MEDNELGLEYGINFNVKKGGDIATKEIEAYNAKWEKYLQENPLKIYFGDGFSKSISDDFKQATNDIKHNMSEMNNAIGNSKVLKDTKWQKNIDDRVNAMEAMKKRLTSIAGEINLLENYSKTSVLRDRNLDKGTRNSWIAELKNEAEGLKRSLSALEGINLQANPADFTGYIKSLIQQNDELKKMEMHYKQVGAEARAYMNSLVGRGEMQKIFSMDDKTAQNIPAKIDAIVKKYNELNAAKNAGYADNRIDIAMNRSLKEYDRLRAKLNEIETKKRNLDASFSTRPLSALLEVNPTSLRQASELMTELAKRKQDLIFTDAKYSQNLSDIASKERQIAEAVRQKTGEITKDANRIQRTNQEAASVDRLNQAYSRQGNIISNLKGIASTYISIYAADRLVRNIAEVTGMFELQEKSLQAIIRDKAAAEEIFSQTKTLAIKSPFQFKELVSYVKQLSAYRVETDQLYETMKNLADVSAGLGVDMNRIILAYGQVKSASVLRGQELRQFTEAGIPLVQELADKFTKLEDRAVSTNEVFGLISARKVPFEMVRDVFGDMTKEGGIFYKMQEVQSETLAGKISNLKDAFDIMFNSIGSSKVVGGILKGTVDAIMNMAKNWQTVGSIVVPLTLALGGYKAAMAAIVAIENIRMAKTKAMTSLYNAEVIALSRKTGIERVNLIISRATAVQNQIEAALLKARVSNVKAAALAEQIGNQTREAGLIVGKQAIVQEEIKTMLMANGVKAKKASVIAEKAYQTAVMITTGETNKLRFSMKELFTSNPIGWGMAIIGVLGSVVFSIINTVKAANKLKNELKEIGNAGIIETSQLQIRFFDLANAAISPTKTIMDQADALEILKKKYADILPDEMLTEKWLKEHAGDWSKATDAINSYVNAKTKETKVSTIEENYSTKSVDILKDLENHMYKYGLSAETAKQVVDEFNKKLLETNPKSLREAEILFEKLVNVTGVDANRQNPKELTYMYVAVKKLYKEAKIYVDQYNKSVNDGVKYTGEHSKEFKKMEEEIKKAKKDFAKEENKYTGYEFDKIKAQKELDLIVKFLKNTAKITTKTLKDALENENWDGLEAELGDQALGFLSKRMRNLIPNKFVSSINSLFQNSGLPNDIITRFEMKPNQQLEDYRSNTEEEARKAYDKKLELLKSEKSYISDLYLTDKKRVATKEEELAILNNTIAAYNIPAKSRGWELIGVEEKEKPAGGTTDKTDYILERYKNQIEIMEQAGETYKDLVASGYTKANALAKTKSLFGDKLGGMAIPTTAKEYIDNYNEAIRLLSSRKGTKDDVFGVTLKIFGVEKEDAQKKMKDYIDAFEVEFDNSKKRVSFFDDLFGATGDFGLASKIAKDLYGDGGVKIQTALHEALKKGLKDTGISETDVFGTDGNINLNKAYELANKLDDNERKKALLNILNATRDFQQKEYMELMKGAEKHQEYEDRITKIMLEGIAKRNKIQNDNRFTTQEKAKLGQSSSNEDNDAIAKIELERFKTSDVWVKAFSDIDRLSIESIKLLSDKIRAFRDKYSSELSATDLKEITGKLEDFDKVVSKLDYKQLFKDIFSPPDIAPLMAKMTAAEEEVKELLALREQAIKDENTATNEYNKYDGAPDSPEKRTAYTGLQAAQLKTKETTDKLTAAQGNLKKAEEDVIDGSNKQTKAIATLGDSVDKTLDLYTDLKNSFDKITSAYKDTAEAMGFAISEEQLAIIDSMTAGLSATVNVIGAVKAGIDGVAAAEKIFSTVGKALKMTNPEIAAALVILTAIITIVSIINKLSMAKYNNEIKTHEKAVEQLSKEYDKLKDAADELLGNEYIANSKKQIKNIREQIKETEELYRAEKKRRARAEFWDSADVDKFDEIDAKMNEYQDKIAGYEKEIADLEEETSAKMAGTDLTSAAESFADAWLDAYLSFGNTADAIKDKFKEMVRSMVINTVLSEIMNKMLSPVFTMITELSKDGKLDANDIAKIFGKTAEITKDIDAQATAAAEGLSPLIDGLRDSTDNLNGLSKGIAGASEETVGILAGYMDSIRFRLFAYIDYMMASGQGNTMSSLMQAQTTQIVHLANIDANTLRSAIANEDLTKEVKKLISVGSKGTYALNVNI